MDFRMSFVVCLRKPSTYTSLVIVQHVTHTCCSSRHVMWQILIVIEILSDYTPTPLWPFTFTLYMNWSYSFLCFDFYNIFSFSYSKIYFVYRLFFSNDHHFNSCLHYFSCYTTANRNYKFSVDWASCIRILCRTSCHLSTRSSCVLGWVPGPVTSLPLTIHTLAIIEPCAAHIQTSLLCTYF